MFNIFKPHISFMSDQDAGGDKMSERNDQFETRRRQRESRPTLVERINDYFDLGKGLVWVCGGIVAATLIYSNNNNTIQALREANNTRAQEIKDLRNEINNRFTQQDAVNASINSKFDQVLGKQNEQLVALTKLQTTIEDNNFQGVSVNHKSGDMR